MSEIIASTYKIIEKIGAGGGGNVYLALHIRLQKNVVLKIDKRKLSTRKELLRREVDILKELNNPYIPQVYDFFVEGENVYTVMDYIEGESLDKALKRGEGFSQPQVIRWACQLLDALCYLHSPIHGTPPRGYVHSDIKPANLMRTSKGDICLIDFNIALALGEENVIGCSAGYASPEHYGLDFSSRYDEGHSGRLEGKSAVSEEDIATVTIARPFTDSMSASGSSSSSMRRKTVIPDVRSDIYSVGATLYHLLEGRRPSKNAKEVAPLSKERFSPQLVRIISRAMEPNPDLRYQTADEMRRDLLGLHKNDPRMLRWKKQRRAAALLFPALFIAGGVFALIGLKRMQQMENWQKRVGYCRTALAAGDVEEARKDSLTVLTEASGSFFPEHVPGAQAVLTEALGVYDLSDGYKFFKTIELSAAPIYLAISPEGKTGAALCGQAVYIFNTDNAGTDSADTDSAGTDSMGVIRRLPAGEQPISEIRYADEDTVLFNGEDGLTAYDIKGGCKLWTGNAASSVSVSGDGKFVAGIDEGGTSATVYDVKTGGVLCDIDFHGKSQNMGIKDNFFALNADGSLLGVSFKDGSFQVYNVEQPEKKMNILETGSGYGHFEGGFFGKYLAFVASGKEGAVFTIIDTESGEKTAEAQSEEAFGVQADENGIYVQQGHILVKVDPVTGEQAPLAASEEDMLCFSTDSVHTLAASEDSLFFFNREVQQIGRYRKEYKSDLLCIAGGIAAAGSMDSPVIRILQYKEQPETEIFSYDAGYRHSEARVSADGETLMLFSYTGFRIYDRAGEIVEEVSFPEPEHVLDQQFVREGKESYLKVVYDNGKADVYSARDGSVIGEEESKRGPGDLDEEFLIGDLRIESPLHGTPIVYDAETEKEVARLKEDTYLTYVTEAGDYLVAQYVTAEGEAYGQLLDERCEVLAELPYLSDVSGEELIFDYPTGSIRKARICGLPELIGRASG